MWRSNAWNRLIYSCWSPVYDILINVAPLRRARAKAWELLNVNSEERLVLIGVGTGVDLPYLRNGITACGVDYTPQMLRRAATQLTTQDTRTCLIMADAMKLPFTDEQFDVGVLNLILAVVTDPKQTLQEAIRVVRPGGRLVVFDKFLPDDQRPSVFRRIANWLMNPFGTDINRQFKPMIEGLPCEILHDEPVAIGGTYRVILLQKIA